MLEKVINWSIQNKFLVILLTLFMVIGGVYSLRNTPVDAIPDLSDVQVIVFTEYPGQAPQVVEDQVTYPLTTQMLSVPGAKVVRGYSFFGSSFVYIIFEDGTDMYWARSRVLEYLNYVSGKLPQGVTPVLGPDATGVGWIYEYTVESDRHNLQELRSIQDWYLRYELTSLEGVSEVASLGGFVKQYQVAVDPNKLVAYNIPLTDVMMAIREGQPRRRRRGHRDRRDRVRGAQPRLYPLPRGPAEYRGDEQQGGDAGAGQKPGRGPDRPGDAAGGRRVERRRGGGRRDCRHALRRKRPEDHRAGQGETGKPQGRPAGRGDDQDRL